MLMLSPGCQDRAETANEAIEIANAHMEGMPLGVNLRTVEVVDMGETWRLSYNLPAGSTGGPILVIVNKRSGEVVYMETQQ